MISHSYFRLRIITILLTLAIYCPVAATAEERYLCVADLATGFRLNPTTKRWEIAKFSVDSVRYIVSKSKDIDYALEIKELGDKISYYHAKKGFDPEGGGAMFSSAFGEFIVNIKTGRYIHYYRVGYVHGDTLLRGQKIPSDTPLIEIGKCSPFE